MENLVISHLKLGILGGGQLGKMLALAASHWDIDTRILDLDEEMPAARVGRRFVKGDFRDYQSVLNFGRQQEFLTLEIESVHLGALQELEQGGIRVRPGSSVLSIIQDKALQNEFLVRHGFPKAQFRTFDSASKVREAVEEGALNVPLVQKLRKFGYDGRGVHIARNQADLASLFDAPSVVEKLVSVKKEISVIASRNQRGEVSAYPAVEMVFHPEANLVEYLVCPADLEPSVAGRAEEMARDLASQLQVTGVLAVEMFLDTNNQLWINEMSPRPHNSGHHTIESCITSQYEQHLRGIFDFPLGSPALKMPSVMVNLLGEPGHTGPVRYAGLTDCMKIEGVKIHIYGKKETRAFRKMGHVTILDRDRDSAMRKAREVKSRIKVTS